MDQKRLGHIGHAVILTAISLAWIGVSIILNRAFPDIAELDYILNKSRNVAVLTPILIWAGIYLNTVCQEDLLDFQHDYAKVALLVGIAWCITESWIYG
jgi:hypothetical protein